MRGTLVLNRLKMPYNRPSITVIIYLFNHIFIIFLFVSCFNKPNKQYFYQLQPTTKQKLSYRFVIATDCNFCKLF